MSDNIDTQPSIYIYNDLPTVEQCQTFLAKINEGRIRIDLEPLEYLDFDNAKPACSYNCLSAINLFEHANYSVGYKYLHDQTGFDERVLAVCWLSENGERLQLPIEITAITDSFDSCSDDSHKLSALRARMIEAGVVEPELDILLREYLVSEDDKIALQLEFV